MLRAIASVGALTLISRMTGFIRDVLTASILGAGPVADAFVVAFRLPNQFRALLAEGAFQAAFIPSFTALRVAGDEEAARRFAQATLTLLLAASLAVSLFMMALPQATLALLAPGMDKDPLRAPLAVTYLRLTSLYLACMSVMAFYAAITQIRERYAAAAAAPILLNVFMVAALLLLVPLLSDVGLSLAIAVPLAGLAQAGVVMAQSFALGERLWPGRLQWSDSLKTFLKRLGPALLGSGIVQISAFADTIIVSFLPAGQISHLYYADRLYQLPFGVIGLALSTVMLPTLSAAFAKKDDEAAGAAFARALELALVLSLPVTIVMAVGAEIAVSGLFGYGAFSNNDVKQTAFIVAAYSAGIPAAILLRCLVPAFQARGDTATPTKITALVLAVSITLKIVLAEPLGAAGIAAATAVAAWLNFMLLAFAARRARLIALAPQLAGILWRAAAGALIAGAVMQLCLFLPQVMIIFSGRSVGKAVLLTALGLGAVIVYGLFLWLSGYLRVSLLGGWRALASRRFEE